MNMMRYKLIGALKLIAFAALMFVVLFACLVTRPAAAGPLSDYMEQQTLRFWFQNDLSVPARPTILYVGLSTAVCSDAALTGEPSAGGYARVSSAATSTFWTGPALGDGTIRNAGALVFPAPTGSWGTVVSWFIADAATGGNVLVCAALTTPRAIASGDGAPTFAANALSFRIDD